ncbi:MAG: hypothetical protein HUU01_11340, partial [Saprospiraceae bacterium]|nr:hypothetical protein [Saprospiraceae bacterium]
MREYLQEMDRWIEEGKPFSAVTVINTWGSAPRPVGTTMFVGPAMEMLGSVSGGCVEGTLLRESETTTAGGVGKHLKFGVSDDDAWSVGLTCGGTIEVFMEQFPGCSDAGFWQTLRRCLAENKSCVWATRIDGSAHAYSLLQPEDSDAVSTMPADLKEHALRAWRERKSQIVTSGGASWFLRVFPRKLQLFVIG